MLAFLVLAPTTSFATETSDVLSDIKRWDTEPYGDSANIAGGLSRSETSCASNAMPATRSAMRARMA
jgi:hypothetical protein